MRFNILVEHAQHLLGHYMKIPYRLVFLSEKVDHLLVVIRTEFCRHLRAVVARFDHPLSTIQNKFLIKDELFLA